MEASGTSTLSEINVPLWEKRVQELTKLLQQQLSLASRGRIEEVEALVVQSDPVVKQLSEMQILERDEFKAEKRKLEKLYRKIYLVLTDRHKGISDELQSIRKGRRTLKAYRRSI
jgi:hypothetical protein